MTLAPESAGRPAPDGIIGRPAMARTLAYFYMAAAALMAVSLALPYPEDSPLGLALVAAAGACGGMLLLWRSESLPRRAVPFLLGLGTLMTTAAIYFSGDRSSFFALLYLWVALEAFYFHGRPWAIAQVGIQAVAYAAVLAVLPGQRPVENWVLVVGVGIVAGALAAYQRGKISTLVASLDDAARTDPLTGLLNRRAFEELFEMELERVHRTGGRVSVLIGDLDGFKAINDRYGHEAGDAVLARWPTTCSSGSARSTPRPASAARSSRCCSRTPTSAAPIWWPSACAAPPTAASPSTRLP